MHSQSIEVCMRMVESEANADFYSNPRVQVDATIKIMHGSHGDSYDMDWKE